MIIAIDPGYTTGFIASRNPIDGKNFDVFAPHEIKWADRFSMGTIFSTYRNEIETVIVEEFRIFNNKKTIGSQIDNPLWSVQVMGIIDAQLYEWGILETRVYQKPSDIHANGKVTVSMLPEHKAQLGFSPHIVDAYTHLRYYLIANKYKQKV